ncbi:MAG: hypothetical protein HQ478_01125 [Chloroflexi bacterium]|nr:hypothetical protein [Chloroflexota bacterium]
MTAVDVQTPGLPVEVPPWQMVPESLHGRWAVPTYRGIRNYLRSQTRLYAVWLGVMFSIDN